MVGPNGSGKSNVIDAMLFVFGKRAKQVHAHRMLSMLILHIAQQRVCAASPEQGV